MMTTEVDIDLLASKAFALWSKVMEPGLADWEAQPRDGQERWKWVVARASSWITKAEEIDFLALASRLMDIYYSPSPSPYEQPVRTILREVLFWEALARYLAMVVDYGTDERDWCAWVNERERNLQEAHCDNR